jgi:hypothetical protein
MNRTTFRLSLAAASVVTSLGVAAAQMPATHHAGDPAGAMPSMPPQAGMPMPMSGTGGPAAGPMGGGMGKMMDMMRPMMAGGMGMPFEHVDGRIAYLKADLKITDAQSAPWNAFADTMRADAASMRAMHEAMGKAPMPTTTPDAALVENRQRGCYVRIPAGGRVLSADRAHRSFLGRAAVPPAPLMPADAPLQPSRARDTLGWASTGAR